MLTPDSARRLIIALAGVASGAEVAAAINAWSNFVARYSAQPQHRHLEFVGKGKGVTKPTTQTDGNVISEEFAVGDEIYVEGELPLFADPAQPIEIEVSWFPSVGEIGKTVQWQVDLLMTNGGTDMSGTTLTLQTPETPVPETAYQRAWSSVSVPAAVWASGGYAEMHFKLSRLSTGANPVNPPRVDHLSQVYTFVDLSA